MKSGTSIGSEAARRRVEGEVRAAVQGYLVDPMEPPAAESVEALVIALGDLLYVVWPASRAAAPDGVRIALIQRDGERVMLTGCVVMLHGGRETSHRLRPMMADLSSEDGTIRVAGASEEIEFRLSGEVKFADANAVKRWERTIRYLPIDAR
jgi:hypothetical protein